MDLVKLSIVGGVALASTALLLSTARQGAADPLPSPTSRSRIMVRPASAAMSPILIDPTAPTPVVRMSSDPSYDGLSLFPAAPGSTRALTFDERWRGGPDAWTAYIDEASRRFGVPPSWIRSVMRAESSGLQFLNGASTTSRKGAMGLMQVMPGTYADLRARYGLGADPYDPRNNVLAGTAYIREMYDRFGAPGFLAAYNAGPGRVGDYLARGRPLPGETRRYLASVAPAVVVSTVDVSRPGLVRVAKPVQDLTSAALLPGRASASTPALSTPAEAPLFVASKARTPTAALQPNTPPNDGLFVVLGGNDRRRLGTPEIASEN